MGLRFSELTRTVLDDTLKVAAEKRPTPARHAYSTFGPFFN